MNDAFDRHADENAPPHPFGASVDANMTGMTDGANATPGLPGDTGGAGALVPLPISNFATKPETFDDFYRNSTAVTPAMLPLGSDALAQTANSNQNSGAAGSMQNASGGLGSVAGYPETGNGAYRAAYDDVIRKATAAYNNRNGYREGDAGYISRS